MIAFPLIAPRPPARAWRPRILVAGDVMLDRYLYGRITRHNPDGQGNVFLIDRVEDRPGGAGAVAAIAQAMGAEVHYFGRLEPDPDGRLLVEALHAAGVELHPCGFELLGTPVKVRMIGGEGKALPGRIDSEVTRELAARNAEYLVRAATREGPWDAVLVADHGKGQCTQQLLAGLESLVPSDWMLVDPARRRPWSEYPAGVAIKCNRIEYNLAEHGPAGTLPGRTIIRTEGAGGASLWTVGRSLPDGQRVEVFEHVPAAEPSGPIVDPIGCGDAVLAALGVCRALGLDWSASVKMAMAAAAEQCTVLGASAEPFKAGGLTGREH